MTSPFETRTADHRQQELADLFSQRSLSQLRQLMVPAVAEAFYKSPLGPYDDRTAKVVRAFGRMAIAGKEVVVPLGQDGPYAIGHITIGEPGGVSDISGNFDNYEDAFRAVFRARWDRLK